jgi:hypothetical protein
MVELLKVMRGEIQGGAHTVKRRKTLKLTVDSHELLMIKNTGQLIRNTGQRQQLSCSECAGQMVVSEQAMALVGVSSRVLHREIEAGIIHFAETAEGSLLICLNSLLLRKREVSAVTNDRLSEDNCGTRNNKH